jgi:hypothetical protein
MAVKGSTYAQELPEGVLRHRRTLKDVREAARARRQEKARKKRADSKG